jgi:NADP-dependent aldehyde dehydrogenase
MTATVLGHNYIGGQRSARGDVALHSLSASTGETYPVAFAQATAEEIDAAVEAAAAAFPRYRALPASARADFLDAIADQIDALGDDFIAEVTRETALPNGRIVSERARTSNQMRLFATVLRRGDFYGARIDRALPERQPIPRPDLRQYQIGLGPVAVFGASNFPLAFSVAGGDTASALAAGCPVVVKAHSCHLVTAEYMANAIERAVQRTGMPAGTFNMIYGERVGARLVQAPGIQAVGFTGSLRGGRALCDLAAAREQPIPVFAEMSSVNPVFVLNGALEERGVAIANELAASVATGCGQLCTSPGLVLGVRSAHFSAFVDHLSRAIQRQTPQTMLNPGIFANFNAAVERASGHAGIRVLASAQGDARQAAPQLLIADASLLFDPGRPLEEEIFGPATIVVEVDDAEQLSRFASAMRGQLTATLIASPDDLRAHSTLIERLEEKAGRLLVNGYPTGVEVSDAIVHGGPWPATSDARGTSVGTLAIDRFLRPVCYQNYPDELLPQALKNSNPLRLTRLVDGEMTQRPLDGSSVPRG